MRIIKYVALFAVLATPSLAGSWETRCTTESVPYQQTVQGATPGQVIGGAVIGGAIGKAATGKDSGMAVGAVIGGAVASENATRTVTMYRDVETCRQVYNPALIYDEAGLRQSILLLNSGGSEGKERTMDVQYTIGVAHDGVWGPRSAAAANAYLQSSQGVTPSQGKEPRYSLLVNNVIVTTSSDVNAIDDLKQGLAQAGVESTILVNVD